MRAHFSKISPEDLVISGKRGWIPGPEESEEAFILRIDKIKKFYAYPPAECELFLTDGDWSAPLECTEVLFGVRPDWIVAHYCNERLPFFQGAATWITEKEGVRIPLIQLKKRFSTSQACLRSEILAHEAIHAVRLQFDELFFEELLAYRTSHNPFRRFFGPLFHRNWEAFLFILLFLLPLIAAVGHFYISNHWVWDLLFWFPWVYTGGLLLRLVGSQLCMVLAIRRARRLKIPPGKELAFLLHLTDREILRFALFPWKKCLKYKRSLRWRQLCALFSFELP